MSIEIIHSLSDAQLLVNFIALGICGLLAIGFFILLIALAESVLRGEK